MTEGLETLRFRDGSTGDSSGSKASKKQDLIKIGRSTPASDAAPDAEFGFAVESVIGVDQRARIYPTLETPWRMITHLSLIGQGVRGTGTGFLVGPRTVLTAGHCLYYEPYFAGFASRVEVSPGRDNVTKPFGTLEGANFRVHPKWERDANPDFDLGCLTLPEPIGEELGWFALAAVDPNDLPGRFVNVAGYPTDLGGTEMYHHAGHIKAVSERRIHYDVDTAPGQSGSPVFVEAEGERVCLAVHAYGSRGSELHVGVESNSAPMLLQSTFDMINAWIEEDNAA